MLALATCRGGSPSAMASKALVLCRGATRRTMAPCLAKAAGWYPSAVWEGRRRGLVTAESVKPMRRFYGEVSVEASGAAWRVTLEHKSAPKPVNTPRGTPLDWPSRALAESVAAEWRSQGEFLKPLEMTLTSIGCTAVDLVRPDRAASVERLLPFLATDTLCFQEVDGKTLAEMQEKEWGPVRRWFEGHFAVSLGVATGIAVPRHGDGTVAAVERDLLGRDEWQLAALEVATQSAKSLIVGLAMLERQDVSAAEAQRWALLEELYQMEHWGLVEGEHDVSHEGQLRLLEGVREFMEGLRGR